MVRTENPTLFWVASKHYKYGGLRQSLVSISNTKFSMLKYGHSEAPFKMIKVPSGKVPVKVMDDQTFLYLQNFSKEKN
jgi:hypothetical protein